MTTFIPVRYIPVKNEYAYAVFEMNKKTAIIAAMKNLARIRKTKGWTQQHLAEAPGVEQPTISKLERGYDGVTLRTLNQIAEALGVEASQLLDSSASPSEDRLVQIFRALPPERQRGWIEMAEMALAESRKADQ